MTGAELSILILGQAELGNSDLKILPRNIRIRGAKELMTKLRKLALRWWNPKRLGSPSQFRWIEKHALPAELESLVTSGHVPGHASIIVHREERRR